MKNKKYISDGFTIYDTTSKNTLFRLQTEKSHVYLVKFLQELTFSRIAIYFILSIIIFFNSLNATAQKKITKKVFHITHISNDSENLVINLKKNKLEAIKFPVSTSAGYSWRLKSISGNLKETYKSKILSAKPNPKIKVVGQKEYIIFYFKGIEKGTGKLEFEYGRFFNENSVAEKELNININIL